MALLRRTYIKPEKIMYTRLPCADRIIKVLQARLPGFNIQMEWSIASMSHLITVTSPELSNPGSSREVCFIYTDRITNELVDACDRNWPEAAVAYALCVGTMVLQAYSSWKIANNVDFLPPDGE